MALPLTINEVVLWSAFQAGADPRVEMTAAGVVLESPTDAVAVWPERWASADAARKALAAAPDPGTTGIIPIGESIYRDNSGCSVSYQSAGPKQHRRAARFDLALIPDPRGWLEARLGPLVHFEIERPAAVVRLRLVMARSLLEHLDSTGGLTAPWRARRDQVLATLARAA